MILTLYLKFQLTENKLVINNYIGKIKKVMARMGENTGYKIVVYINTEPALLQGHLSYEYPEPFNETIAVEDSDEKEMVFLETKEEIKQLLQNLNTKLHCKVGFFVLSHADLIYYYSKPVIFPKFLKLISIYRFEPLKKNFIKRCAEENQPIE